MRVNSLLLALGANLAGPWGSPRRDITPRAARAVVRRPAHPRLLAHLRHGAAGAGTTGALSQRSAALAGANSASGAIAAHQTHRAAARDGAGTRWGPRCLDIDILGLWWQAAGLARRGRQRGRLILPHPEMHGARSSSCRCSRSILTGAIRRLGVAGRTLLARLGHVAAAASADPLISRLHHAKGAK